LTRILSLPYVGADATELLDRLDGGERGVVIESARGGPSREPERRRLRTPPTVNADGRGGTVSVVPVRTGEPSDAAFIVEMARLASVIENRPLPPADDPALVRGLPPAPDTAVLALDAVGRPVGAAWWHFRDPPLVVTPGGEQVPEIVVAVLPHDRGRGVGRCLLDALAARAAGHGYDRLALNVHIRNPAARLYSRIGFEVAGEGRGPLGVAMVLQLPVGRTRPG
jgi:GNAT superfamily N-acetyltransferase